MKTKTLPPHCVRARQFFYGPTETTSIAFVGTLAECKEFIQLDDKEVYRTSHNESGRWVLKIVTTNSLSPSARRNAEYKIEEQSGDA
jgi:hypothetical protein